MIANDIDDYTGLLTSAYRDKTLFVATVSAVIQPLCDLQALLAALPGQFDLDNAVGDQLDATGVWIGLSRRLQVPIAGVYFSLDTAGVGFDEGVWWNSTEPLTGLTNLDDGTYRLMLKAKVAANIWDGSLGNANAMLNDIFPDNGVVVIDNLDMTQTIRVDGTSPSALFTELVDQGYIELKPAGVELV